MNTQLIQPNEIETSLPTFERQALLMALNSSLAGMSEITVAFTYDKQTDTRPRLAGKDYVPIPGMSTKMQLGKIQRVFRNQDGKVRFTISSMTRGDGMNPTGFVTIIPEGIKSFTITGFHIPVHGMTAI